MARVTYGQYTYRRLVRAKLLDLASTVKGVNAAVLSHGRKVEDMELPEMEAIADRDADDDDLDDTAQDARLNLGSRHVGADRERPYTDVFPKGIDYYTAAALGEQQTRYRELIQRTTEHLPPTDPVRVEHTPKLESQLGSWVKSAEDVGSARNSLEIARTARDAAVDDWITTMEKVYGAVVNKYGKKKAERFFRRRKRGGKEEGETDETG